MTAFTRTWNTALEAIPADANVVSQGAQRMRERWVDLRERLEVDHEFGGESGTPSEAGYHKKITFREQSGDPTIPANNIGLYSKDVTGKTELFWKDPDSNVTQLTHLGKLRAFITSNRWTGAQISNEYSLGTTSGAINTDLVNGQHFSVTLNGGATFQAPANAQIGAIVVLRVIQDGTGFRTVNFGSNFTKVAGLDITASTDANKQDIYTIYRYTASTWTILGIQKDITSAL